MAKQIPMFNQELLGALSELTGGNLTDVVRVVIDIRAHELPVVHVERLGDDKLIDVIRNLGDVTIERKEP